MVILLYLYVLKSILKQVKKYFQTERHLFIIYYGYDNNCLGQIRWFSSWRKFCFYPNMDTIWDNKCLCEVVEFLDTINKDYKSKK